MRVKTKQDHYNAVEDRNSENLASELTLDILQIRRQECGIHRNQKLLQIDCMYAKLGLRFENYVRIVIHQQGQRQMCHGASHREASAGAHRYGVQDGEECHGDTSEAMEYGRDQKIACLGKRVQEYKREHAEHESYPGRYVWVLCDLPSCEHLQ